MDPMIYSLAVFLTTLLALSACTHARKDNESCDQNPKIQTTRSAELQEIAKEDQSDRAGPYSSIDWQQVTPRDLQRRKRVGEISAEGCLKSASDYASAAIVYQHGVTDSHYYQAFVWANEAVKLGDESQRWLTAAAVDRYLVTIGHKQLFGTQFSKRATGPWCIQPVEKTFPDSKRVEYVKLNLQDEIAQTLKGIGTQQSPEQTKNCEPSLKPSPPGTLPGFW